ncbi:hypothetical protein QBC33DRAFT_615726 [Phialemonium atrogriseum]|uniref:Uncharacterized protein n=1 Tax=Phialemonium atrogriseum TaxID=1093897 RepID=A0AAJ0C8K7_9PEZI|nr:uncharacterized protein QBC33DRAFT_615726 [Phialemonium atrogriseum]KAK1771497.1 hypothetical protein QBC33DRAFT_615726 [Phialemonium atrogriseum]
MDPPSNPLRGFLNRKTPTLTCAINRGTTSVNPDWPELGTISRWTDFTQKNIEDAYGHILNRDMGSLSPPSLTEQLDEGELELRTQRDFQDLVDRNIKVLQDALVEGKDRLGAYAGATLKQGCREHPVRSNNGGLSWPDHSIYLDESPPIILVIGLWKALQTLLQTLRYGGWL